MGIGRPASMSLFFKALCPLISLAGSLRIGKHVSRVMPKITLIQLIALAGIVLMLAVALCVFDGGEGLNSDLWLMSLAIPTGTLIIFLVLAGGLVLSPPETYRLLLADLSSPPPKT